jgi:hypothetical protein
MLFCPYSSGETHSWKKSLSLVTLFLRNGLRLMKNSSLTISIIRWHNYTSQFVRATLEKLGYSHAVLRPTYLARRKYKRSDIRQYPCLHHFCSRHSIFEWRNTYQCYVTRTQCCRLGNTPIRAPLRTNVTCVREWRTGWLQYFNFVFLKAKVSSIDSS